MAWSKADLIDESKNNYFENQALVQNNLETSVSPALQAQVAWEFVDDYHIELINPDLPISEKEIENAIIKISKSQLIKEKMINEGFSYAQKFTDKNIATNLFKVYKDLK